MSEMLELVGQHAPQPPEFDVVIAGAGPVGLFVACELALRRCSVLVLDMARDPHSPLKHLPFGLRGLSAPTVEALDRRGLLHEFEVHKRIRNPHKTPTPEGARRQVGHFAGIPFFEGNVDVSQWKDRLPSSTPASLISEMAEVEAVLARRAEASGVEIRRESAVTGFEQTPEGVTVRTEDGVFRGKWLVGCDGSRSLVRKMGGFTFVGTEPEFTGYSVQLEIADPEKLQPGRVMTPEGMYFQSQPGYLVMAEFDGGAAHHKASVTLDHVQSVLRRISATDVSIKTLHAVTTWTDRARQATSYRSGRVLLAGDAAHIHSPLVGQGLNLGLGDAMNLGWKLAATLRDTAPEGLLDTYRDERHPAGEQVLNWSRAQVVLMRPDQASRALQAVVRDLLDTRDAATYIAGRVWGVSSHYELGGGHRLLGHSVPNFKLASGASVNELLRDGRGALLDFDSDPELQSLSARYGDVMRYICSRPQNPLGLSAVLVRPDGIVAWASDVPGAAKTLRHAADRWFVTTGIH